MDERIKVRGSSSLQGTIGLPEATLLLVGSTTISIGWECVVDRLVGAIVSSACVVVLA